MIILSVSLKKQLGKFNLNMNFSVKDGEILVVVGESGCGKSTLLNLISGVLDLDEGFIISDIKAKNKNISQARIYVDTQKNLNLPIFKRHIGYIQQKSNLFPHMTALENICYSFSKSRPLTLESKLKLDEFCEIFKLSEHLDKYPSQLSGGQQQRISIVRAVMSEPDILLFDEPFSALDNILRDCLRNQITTLKNLLQIPILFVTHDMQEAYSIADRVMYAEHGHIIEIGTTAQLFHLPQKKSTAEFVGFDNLIPAIFISLEGDTLIFKSDELTFKIDKPTHKIDFKKPLTLGVRPSNIMFVKDDKNIPPELTSNLFCATIEEEISLCDTCRLRIKIKGLSQALYMKLSYYTKEKYHLRVGVNILISIRQEHLLVLL